MINVRPLITSIIFSLALAALGFLRLEIDTDVMRSLPTEEKVITDALDIFSNHPIHDQVAVDIMLDRDDPDILVECGEFVEAGLAASGLFAQVGLDEISGLLPELALHVVNNLPMLFSARELEQFVSPRLNASAIDAGINNIYSALSGMESIGQEKFIAGDPLGLKDLVMAKLALLAPSLNSRFYKGHLLSGDSRHLLVTARPRLAGTDTAGAAKIAALLSTVSAEATSRSRDRGYQVTLTPAGAYRAALDNELIIRRDVKPAIWLATAGIALLLLTAFPRPLIGLLSLLPAVGGTAAALFAYSLFSSTISIMVLGFGGAVISITVDHGIAYLLFRGSGPENAGKNAGREVRAVGIMAVLTSMGAFIVLCFSGFPIFVELGRFTALGIFFSFLFVHLVFPRIFRAMPTGPLRVMPLQRVVDALFNSGKAGAGAAIIFALVMLFYARPEFNTNLSAMNTVSNATLAADALFTRVWGNISSTYLMVSGAGIREIQTKDDLLLEKIREDVEGGLLAPAFVPAMIFPGENLSRDNFAAWREFWDQEKISRVKERLAASAALRGFAPEAFAPFFNLLDNGTPPADLAVPARYYSLLGISKAKDRPGLVQFLSFTPGASYSSSAFVNDYRKYGKIFDPQYFSGKLGDLLFSTFSRMFVIIAGSVTVLLFSVFLSWRLTLLTLLPVAFAYVATLGTLKLMNHPLDIPGLMLSIVILGMGIDYSIFFVRAHQRYRDVNHPSYGLVRRAVFMAGASTLIGFGVLATADHSLLYSAGLVSLLGIGYSLIGANVLLPPLLNVLFSGKNPGKSPTPPAARVRARYRLVEAYPRLFARFKLKFDPMFADLERLLPKGADIKTIVDIGCGYGVPAAWCLEYFPRARIFGLDPDPERVRVAALALEDRGVIKTGHAPEMPELPGPADLILLLDMVHYLDDNTLISLFNNSFRIGGDGAMLVARFVILPAGRPSRAWRREDFLIKMAGMTAHYRPPEKIGALLNEAGFTIEMNRVSAPDPELFWVVGRVKKADD